jgi:hypothetical protein
MLTLVKIGEENRFIIPPPPFLKIVWEFTEISVPPFAYPPVITKPSIQAAPIAPAEITTW